MERIKQIEERNKRYKEICNPEENHKKSNKEILELSFELKQLNKQRDNDIEYLLAENKRLTDTLKQAHQKSQTFASHIAYCKDKYYSVDPADTFDKAQAIYELLDSGLKQE